MSDDSSAERHAPKPPEEKISSAEMFKRAFQRAMQEEQAEHEKAPKVFTRGEGVHEVVDADDKHMGE